MKNWKDRKGFEQKRVFQFFIKTDSMQMWFISYLLNTDRKIHLFILQNTEAK